MLIIKHKLLLLTFLCTVFSVNADIISDTDKHAWSANAGWFNFKATHKQARVYDDHLEGYVWAQNIGWIRLGSFVGGGNHSYANNSATSYGINNDGAGNLSGYAWSANIGWINFNPTHSQVTIDPTTGDFDGYAWSQNIGWIHFNNVSPAYKVTRLLSGTYRIGVSVTGLATSNTVQLRNNNTEDLTVSSNGTFYFLSELIDGNNYSVMVTTQPDTPNQTCLISSAASGTVNAADVILSVNCTTAKYFIGGTASGMIAGNFLTIQNNNTDDLSIDSDGAFVFNTPIDDETNYTVNTKTRPNNPLQSCNISNPTGTIAGTDVTNVAINCIIEIIFADGFE